MLYIGEEVGQRHRARHVDIALDPLEGTTLTAKDMPNALTVIAMGPRGSMLHAPDVYMDKLAIGPGYPQGVVALDMGPAERVEALAKAKAVPAKTSPFAFWNVRVTRTDRRSARRPERRSG